MRIVKQNRFKNLELHKKWTEAGVKTLRATTQMCQGIWLLVVVKGVLPGPRRRIGLLPSGLKFLFSDESKFWI